jgi:hypothetical protein
MKFKSVSIAVACLTGSCVLFSNTAAQAFSFTTNFKADLTGSNAAKGNIWLQSVKLSDGKVVNNFSLVNRAVILQNDQYKGKNTGAASSDRGDLASGIKKEDPTANDIATSLGNLNLNNIIDTEDTGSFKMNVFFNSAVDKLLLWERGRNSTLGIQAIDAAGKLLGNFREFNSKTWNYAGYNIDTTEITGAQQVGSLGVSLADLGVTKAIAGIQLTSKKTYNGPDFKVVGTKSVPEPMTLAGLGLVAGIMSTTRRRSSTQA